MLATLVIEGGPWAQEAFRALAESSADTDAIRWLLVCASANQAWWTYVTPWPDEVHLDAETLSLLQGELAAASDEGQTQRVVALGALLPAVLPVACRRGLARSVLLSDGGQDHALHSAARTALIGSRTADDRDALLADSRRGPLGIQILRLAALSPTRRAEKDFAREALELLANTSVNLTPQELVAVQDLAAAQPKSWFSSWLLGTWVYEPARQSIVDPRLGEMLGARRLTELVDAPMPPTLATRMAGASEGLSVDDATVVVAALYAAGHVVPDALRRFFGQVSFERPAWLIAVACQDDTVARVLGPLCRPGDLIAGASLIAADPRAAEVIAAVAEIWSQTSPNRNPQGHVIPQPEWGDEVSEVSGILGDRILVALAKRSGGGFMYPSRVLDLVLESSAARAAFAEHNLIDQLINRALSSDIPSQAAGLLTDRTDDVRHAQEHLLRAIGYDDHEIWASAVSVCDLPAITEHLGRQVESLGLPLSQRVPAAILRTTLAAAIILDISVELGSRTNGILAALLAHPSDEVVTLACAWADRLVVTENEHALVDATILADDQRGHAHPDLPVLRDQFTARLIDNALNTEIGDEVRIKHLELAVRSGPKRARTAALTFTAPESDDLRLAAARILRDTPGQAGEEARIDELIASAKKVELREVLGAARVALSASDVATALTSLATKVGIDATRKEVVDARLGRYPDQEATLLQLLNDVRASAGSSGPAKSFINECVSLCDHLVDLAILATSDAGKTVLKRELVELIRKGAKSRPDHGALVHAQSVLTVLPWVSHVASLRQGRSAHPNRPNSTTPVIVTDRQRDNAEYLLCQILPAWLRSMTDN